jgi:hypothetical protein
MIAAAARRVFGHKDVAMPGFKTGRKQLSRMLVGDYYNDYYLPQPPRNWDPAHARAIEKRERLRVRGKVGPKKGQGKRATRK